MTSPVLTVDASAPVNVAARLLARERVRRLFVVDGSGRLAGVVSRRDLLRVYLVSPLTGSRHCRWWTTTTGWSASSPRPT